MHDVAAIHLHRCFAECLLLCVPVLLVSVNVVTRAFVHPIESERRIQAYHLVPSHSQVSNSCELISPALLRAQGALIPVSCCRTWIDF